MSPKGVSILAIFGTASKGYFGGLKALAPVALVESTAFAVLTLVIGLGVDAGGSNLLLLQGSGLSLSAGAWILSAFAAAEVGIHEQHSSETPFQRVRRRVGALIGLTLVVNAIGFGLIVGFLWALPSAADDGLDGLTNLLFLFLLLLAAVSLITNLAVSVLMIEDCSVRKAWSRAMDLLPMDGTVGLAVASGVVLFVPAIAGIAAGLVISSVTGAPAEAAEFVGGIAGETIFGPFVAAFLVGVYVYLRDRQIAEAVGVVGPPSLGAE